MDPDTVTMSHNEIATLMQQAAIASAINNVLTVQLVNRDIASLTEPLQVSIDHLSKISDSVNTIKTLKEEDRELERWEEKQSKEEKEPTKVELTIHLQQEEDDKKSNKKSTSEGNNLYLNYSPMIAGNPSRRTPEARNTDSIRGTAFMIATTDK